MKFYIVFSTLILFAKPQLFAQKHDSIPVFQKKLTEVEKTHLKLELTELDSADQKYRKLWSIIEKQYGKESGENKENYRLWKLTDSINIIKIDSLLALYGYDNLIENGANTLFLIIQHADLERQLKFIPIFKKSARQKKLSLQDIALMEDRINDRTCRKQVYGTQICKNRKTGEQFVCPLEDPDNVDKRRAELDLPDEYKPISAYCKYFGIEWNLEEYKRRLPEYEAIQKARGTW
jgi:hypothetical protein